MRVTRSSMQVLLLVVLSWCSCTFAAASGIAAGLPPDFRAEYALRKAGIPIARAEVHLERDASGLSYRSRSTTVGLAAIFRNDVITEEARLEFDATGVPRIQRYVYRHSYRNTLREDHTEFDWVDLRARGEVKGKTFDIGIPPDAVDHFSLQLRIMQDLQRPHGDMTYAVVERDRLKSFAFRHSGDETLATALGRLDSLRVERVDDPRGSQVITWYAPALHHLPVRIEQIERDGGRLTMTLESLEWLADGDAAPSRSNP
ncbi:MAG: DUF3108 domain-containing protein [Chromatiales bacterium]|nr:DUF3108 domain-containing protein [Chromatiales bacterium]